MATSRLSPHAATPDGEPRHRVSYVIGTYPSLTTTFIDREIAALRSLGVDIVVVSIRRPQGQLSPAQERAAGEVRYLLPTGAGAVVRAHGWALRHRPMAYLGSFMQLLTAPHHGASRRRSFLHWLEGVSIASMLRDRRGVGLHAHFADRAAAVALVAARLLASRYSVTAHANDIYVSPVLLDLKVANSTLTATCTQHNLEHLQAELTPGAASRVRRIYHGLDLGSLEPQPRDTRDTLLVSVAQLKEKKGLADLIAAVRILREQGRTIGCEIAGDGPLRSELQAAIDGPPPEAPVRLLGSLPHGEVVELLQRASAFVLPSVIASDGDRDGIPNVILEAMAMGLPVVSTAISGIPEVVDDGVTGFIVPPGDPEALARAIARLMDDPSLGERMGSAGRAFVQEHFDVDRNAMKLLEAWEGSER